MQHFPEISGVDLIVKHVVVYEIYHQPLDRSDHQHCNLIGKDYDELESVYNYVKKTSP